MTQRLAAPQITQYQWSAGPTLATDFLAAVAREDDGQLIETFQRVGLMGQKLAILAKLLETLGDVPIVMAALLWVRSRDRTR